jgi:hypothetical protein
VSGRSKSGGRTTGHAMCITGFRVKSGEATRMSGRMFDVPDESAAYVYVHDDNLGPNVRCEIGEERGFVRLRPEARARASLSEFPDPLRGYGHFIPNSLLVAVPGSLRTSPDALHRAGAGVADAFAAIALGPDKVSNGVTLNTLFIGIRPYLCDELARLLQTPSLLARARLGLTERVPPLSLHLGLVRLGDGPRPLVDILYDTTDRDRALRPCAHIVFDPRAGRIVRSLEQKSLVLGVRIDVSG